MTVRYQDYSIDIIDDRGYSLNPADNSVHYAKEYFDETVREGRFIPASKHGIRIKQDGIELSSAILCETGGATGIHKNSFLFADNSLFICCCDKVYALKLPDLEMIWKKELDLATCFGIYEFDGDFIIHGEISITRIDKNGNEKWRFGARDIFVTQDGSESIKVHPEKIELKDWQGYNYVLDKNGNEIK